MPGMAWALCSAMAVTGNGVRVWSNSAVTLSAPSVLTYYSGNSTLSVFLSSAKQLAPGKLKHEHSVVKRGLNRGFRNIGFSLIYL